MNWLTNNWDKILGFFFSIIVAGLIGFFSAIISLKGDISEIRTQITQIKVEIEKAINPKLSSIDSHADKISTLEKTVIVLSTNTELLRGRTEDLSRQTNSMLFLRWNNDENRKNP